MNNTDRNMESPKRYRLTHFWTPIYLGCMAICVIGGCFLMDKDPDRFLPIAIPLFVAALVATVVYLTAFSRIRKEDNSRPAVRPEATNTAGLLPSAQRYAEIRKAAGSIVEKGQWDAVRYFIGDLLTNGRLQPAKVVDTKNFTICVYDRETDAVVRMQFPGWLADRYGLHAGDRLLTVNCYYQHPFAGHGAGSDLFPGPNRNSQWEDLCSLPVLFFCDQEALMQQKLEALGEAVWQEAEKQIEQHQLVHGDCLREGFWFVHPTEADWNRHVLKEARFI